MMRCSFGAEQGHTSLIFLLMVAHYRDGLHSKYPLSAFSSLSGRSPQAGAAKPCLGEALCTVC